MKKISIIIGLAIMASLAFSCKSKTTGTTNSTVEKRVVYTCSMHPEVQSDKPGQCPKCGMTLVVKE